MTVIKIKGRLKKNDDFKKKRGSRNLPKNQQSGAKFTFEILAKLCCERAIIITNNNCQGGFHRGSLVSEARILLTASLYRF